MRYNTRKRTVYSTLSNNEEILKAAKKQLVHKKQKTNNNERFTKQLIRFHPIIK